jgi:hypothetical protein
MVVMSDAFYFGIGVIAGVVFFAVYLLRGKGSRG